MEVKPIERLSGTLEQPRRVVSEQSLEAIRVDGISKAFGRVQAVDGLSFSVRRSEIFGLLGPNGAGKTTALSIIQGLRPADAGDVSVLGMDITTDARAIKARIGVQLQTTSLLRDLGALEQVMLFARLYGRPTDRAHARALLGRFELEHKANARPRELSGGQRQRLAIALALVNDPEIVLLDEPTAGLDPQSRRLLWAFVRDLRVQGRTIVITTHYMEEAEALCDRVGIIDHGRLLALDSPARLIDQLDGLSTITCSTSIPVEVVRDLPGVIGVSGDGDVMRLQTRDILVALEGLLGQSKRLAVPVRSMHVEQPNLEDVFLQHTGRTIRD